MTDITITVTGDKELHRNLAKLQPPEFDRRMNRAAFALGKELEGIMKPYPPPPAQSTYRRTGKLKRGWGTAKAKWGALVKNPTLYGPWVQSEAQQTKVHKATGWLTDVKGAQELSKRDATIKRIVLQSLMQGVN